MIKVFAIIPCYNEEEYIGNLVSKLIGKVHKVIVVDNNSTDKTSEIAEQSGAEVIHCKEVGAGAATRKGIMNVN